MRRLIAIVILAAALSGAVLVLAAMTLARPAFSADKPQGRMQACTQTWLDMKAAGQTAGLSYRPFVAHCMKGEIKAQPQTLAAPVKITHVKVKSAKRSASGKKPNRMKLCGARWRQMKVDAQTRGQKNGMTYRQFSKQCLKAT